MGELFTVVFKNPTINLLLFFYQIFLKVGIPGAFGFAIIGLTATIRGVLNPFFAQQIALSKKMSEIKPHLEKLSEKHKNDKKKLQEEQMKLYREMGINPAAGCLFALVQMPVFIALYQVLYGFFENGKKQADIVAAVNQVVYTPALKISKIDPQFFSLNLAVAPSHFGQYGVHYLVIPIVTAVLQYYQIALSTPPAPVQKPDDKAKGKKEDDMQMMMSKQMKFMFPIMIGYFSYTLPVGLSLYWNIFSLFSIWQYRAKPEAAVKLAKAQ